jgi:2-keto-4-pentenoate hydratase/2-oxohepta-3-ene-1,7-dioic acid hydratase in catechol pathway
MSDKINRIFCVGRNYYSHIKEMNNKIPSKPLIFLKQKNSISFSRDIFYPDVSKEFSYEAELVLKLGEIKKTPLESINEFALGLDLTLRDVQRKCIEKGHPWEKSKAFDKSAPIGKFYSMNSLDYLNDLEFVFKINNDIRQIGIFSNMIFSLERIISEISLYWKLEEGDLIFTGTPEGVGTLNRGDILELSSNKTGAFVWNVV